MQDQFQVRNQYMTTLQQFPELLARFFHFYSLPLPYQSVQRKYLICDPSLHNRVDFGPLLVLSGNHPKPEPLAFVRQLNRLNLMLVSLLLFLPYLLS